MLGMANAAILRKAVRVQSSIVNIVSHDLNILWVLLGSSHRGGDQSKHYELKHETHNVIQIL